MDEVKEILENDEIEKLLIESCRNKEPQGVNKVKIVKKGQKKKEEEKKENKKENKKEDKKEDKKEVPKKKPKPKAKKEESSSSSSSSSGSESDSSEGGSSSGSGSSSSGSDSDSDSSSDSNSSNKNKKNIGNKNKKITIDQQTLEDFKNKQDNHLIMIFENEIKDQVSNEEEIQILNSLNEAIEFQSPGPFPEEDQSPIPFQVGDEINDEKFYTYVKECIKKIKNDWNEYSKQYLKNIIAKFRKTQNIFTYRRYLKEPFKSILTDFLLYIMTKNNLKEEDILKLAEPIIDKSWPVSVIVKDKDTKEEKKENKDNSDDNNNSDQMVGKKRKRKGTYQDYSSSSSDDNDDEKEKDKKKEDSKDDNKENINKENKDDNDKDNNLGKDKKYELNEGKKDKEGKEENKESDKMEEEEEEISEKGVKHVYVEQNLKEGEIKLDKEYTSIIDIFNFSAQRQCIELGSDAPITKYNLNDYLPQKTIVSCFVTVLSDTTGKEVDPKQIKEELLSFIKNSERKIYFIDMDESRYSFTLYNGSLVVNKKFFDLMNGKKDKIQFGVCYFLLSIFHEMGFLLAVKLIHKLNLRKYYKNRRDIIETVGEHLEESLLGRKKRMREIGGRKIYYTTFGLLPLKNVKYIANYKIYIIEFNRCRRQFVKMHNENPITMQHKNFVDYIKYEKNDLNYNKINLKDSLYINHIVEIMFNKYNINFFPYQFIYIII